MPIPARVLMMLLMSVYHFLSPLSHLPEVFCQACWTARALLLSFPKWLVCQHFSMMWLPSWSASVVLLSQGWSEYSSETCPVTNCLQLAAWQGLCAYVFCKRESLQKGSSIQAIDYDFLANR